MSSGASETLCLLAVGTKGLGLALDLAALGEPWRPKIVATYEPRATREPGPDEFRAHLDPLGVQVREGRRPDIQRWIEEDGVDVLMYAGWQYMTGVGTTTPTVVLHDSLLPHLRGFNPTVTALIEGDSHLGVTAFIPTGDVDAGPIISQHAVQITHPVAIAEALELIRPCYLATALDAIRAVRDSSPTVHEQDHSLATYSIWRDDADYRIDLAQDSDRVVRTVLALGDPYMGAYVLLGDRRVHVLAARTRPDIPFVGRDPGKVWRIEDDGPVVVCGSGMVQFTSMVDDAGHNVIVDRVRTRFS